VAREPGPAMSPDRPRDRLGRPLPPDAPADQRGPVVPDVGDLDDAAAWRMAWQYALTGLPFHAHEVCEQRWRMCRGVERDAWRALAQWGAAETHEARGSREGARRLAGRALDGLDRASALPDGVDVDAVRSRCAILLGE
jgi:hypothetical protein